MTWARYCYQFPENKRANASTTAEQAEKLMEEAFETKLAHAVGEKAIRVCEEALDAIVAAEGVLRKYPVHTVDAAYELVIDKNAKRGDWGGHYAK